MSKQTPELLNCQGKKLSFLEEPLAPYLEFHEIDDRFLSYSSENERGYIGIWEIIENKLYLSDLKGFDEDMQLIGMEAIFQNPEPVFAAWYTGEINILVNTGIVGGAKKWIKRRLIFQDGLLIDELDQDR